MTPDRHLARSRLLATSLGIGMAVATADCGGAAQHAAVTTTSKAPSTVTTIAGATRSAELAAVVNCLTAHGMTILERATAREVRAAFAALPNAGQQTVFEACSSTLPAKPRQKIQAVITGESPTTTTVAP